MLTTITFIAACGWFFTKYIYKPRDGFMSEPLRVSDGPKLTPEEEKTNYQIVRRLLEYHPGGIAHRFPDIMRDIELSKRYNELEMRYRSGALNDAGYEIELNKMVKGIDISEVSGKRSFWNAIRQTGRNVFHSLNSLFHLQK